MSNTFDDVIKMKAHELIFEKRKFASVHLLGSTAQNSLRIEQYDDLASGDTMQRLSGYVLSQRLADDHYLAKAHYKVHSSWWQHFKQEHMPTWFNDRWPVRYDERTATVDVKFTRYATYPMANIAVQENPDFFKVRLGGVEVIQDSVEQVR